MYTKNKSRGNKGFSLIETIVYVGILAVIAGAFNGIFQSVLQTQVSESGEIEVTNQLNFALQTIQRSIKDSSLIDFDTCEATSTLSLIMPQDANSPTIFYEQNDRLYIQQGSNSAQAITNEKVTVDSIEFKKICNAGGKDTIEINLALSKLDNSTSKRISHSLTSAVSRVNAVTFDSSILPPTDATYDVGTSPTLRWRNGAFSGQLKTGELCIVDDCKTAWPTSGTGTSQWTTSGANIYYTTGSVAVGTTTPSDKLHLHSTSTAAAGEIGLSLGITADDSDNRARARLYALKNGSNGGQFRIQTLSSGSLGDRFVIDASSNVGIGIATNLGARLHIRKTALTYATSTFFSTDALLIEDTEGTMEFAADDSGNFGSTILLSNVDGSTGARKTWGLLNKATDSANRFSISYGTTTNINDYGSTGEKLTISTAGNVGIGKTSPAVALDVTGTINATGAITSSGTAGVGYTTGAGGTVTQLTSKSTGVTINKTTGQITMHNAALAAAAEVAFTVTNSTVAATDTIVLSIKSGGTAGAYIVTVGAVGSGSFSITLGNASGGSLSEAVVISFAVIKGVSS